jgi:hypothetical protein
MKMRRPPSCRPRSPHDPMHMQSHSGLLIALPVLPAVCCSAYPHLLCPFTDAPTRWAYRRSQFVVADGGRGQVAGPRIRAPRNQVVQPVRVDRVSRREPVRERDFCRRTVVGSPPRRGRGPSAARQYRDVIRVLAKTWLTSSMVPKCDRYALSSRRRTRVDSTRRCIPAVGCQGGGRMITLGTRSFDSYGALTTKNPISPLK